MKTGSLRKYIYLSIAAAVVTISLKLGAYFLTGSVGLLSDGLESCVNLIAEIVALNQCLISGSIINKLLNPRPSFC